MAGLTRGTLAKKSGVNVETVRFYEKQGLIPEPPRNASNYRMYPEDAVRRLQFIRRAQELGFTLKEIRDLLSLRATPGVQCADVRGRAEEKVRDIDERVRTLRSIRKALSRLIAECSGSGAVTDCPILEALDPEEKG